MLQALAGFGILVLMTFAIPVLIAVAVFVPAFFASTINTEASNNGKTT
jgi:hypothetical protein